MGEVRGPPFLRLFAFSADPVLNGARGSCSRFLHQGVTDSTFPFLFGTLVGAFFLDTPTGHELLCFFIDLRPSPPFFFSQVLGDAPPFFLFACSGNRGSPPLYIPQFSIRVLFWATAMSFLVLEGLVVIFPAVGSPSR